MNNEKTIDRTNFDAIVSETIDQYGQTYAKEREAMEWMAHMLFNTFDIYDNHNKHIEEEPCATSQNAL